MPVEMTRTVGRGRPFQGWACVNGDGRSWMEGKRRGRRHGGGGVINKLYPILPNDDGGGDSPANREGSQLCWRRDHQDEAAPVLSSSPPPLPAASAGGTKVPLSPSSSSFIRTFFSFFLSAADNPQERTQKKEGRKEEGLCLLGTPIKEERVENKKDAVTHLSPFFYPLPYPLILTQGGRARGEGGGWGRTHFLRGERGRGKARERRLLLLCEREREKKPPGGIGRKKEDRLGRCLHPWPSLNGLLCVFPHGIRTLFQEEKAGK